MPKSLVFKLMGAFLLVIAVGAAVISVLISRATENAFTIYTTRSGQAWAQQLAPELADYYVQNLGWQGVDQVLGSALPSAAGTATGNMPGMQMGNGAGQGRGYRFGAQGFAGGMMGMMNQRLILADEQGMVISDTQAALIGKQLSADDLQNGAPVMVNGAQVATLIISPGDITQSGTPAGEFLASVNQAVVSSVIIAALIALALGALLSFQITAPLRRLKEAAMAIARGELGHRVKVQSRDELGDLGQAFNQMADSLDSLEIQRQHLVADVAHELRTPLTAIQGTLEAMQDGVLPLDEEQLTALHGETLLLRRLVEDLRLLSLAEAGQLKLERQEVQLSEVIRQACDRFQAQAQQKGTELLADVPDTLPLVWADADRIAQVLNNLIGNALRYISAGGRISVQAVETMGPEKGVEVAVTDSGPGIEPEALPYVFDRFYRADKSRARASGGSGLGLAIVKQLVEAHGGKVAVTSPVYPASNSSASGTRFSFTLPAEPK